MIKPTKPSINFYTPDDDLVKYDEYLRLEKYCDHLGSVIDNQTEFHNREVTQLKNHILSLEGE